MAFIVVIHNHGLHVEIMKRNKSTNRSKTVNCTDRANDSDISENGNNTFLRNKGSYTTTWCYIPEDGNFHN
jgi:hypothetical protein